MGPEILHLRRRRPSSVFAASYCLFEIKNQRHQRFGRRTARRTMPKRPCSSGPVVKEFVESIHRSMPLRHDASDPFPTVEVIQSSPRLAKCETNGP